LKQSSYFFILAFLAPLPQHLPSSIKNKCAMTKLVVIEFDEFKNFTRQVIQEEFKNAFNPKVDQVSTSDERLLSRAQMAKELNVSLVTLHQWQKDGLPYRRLHRRIYFVKSEVLNYMYTNQKSKKKG
jgi:hypothetical protein